MTATQLVIVLVAVIIGSVAKAVTGMGLPVIAIPIAALFVDIDTAVVVIAFPNVLANAFLAFRERAHFHDTRDLPTLAVAGVIGAVAGTFLFVSIPETPLIVAVIVAIFGYVALFFLHPDLRVGPHRSKRLAPPVGLVAGGFQGAIGISGPIVGSWIHSYRLQRGAHILSVTTLFMVTGFAELVVLIGHGEFAGRVPATLLACIPVLGSIPLGTRLRDRVSARGFDLAIVGVLSVSGAALAIETFA